MPDCIRRSDAVRVSRLSFFGAALLAAGLVAASPAALAVTCVPITLYENDFESGTGLADWTMVFYIGEFAEDWRGIQACAAHSGSKIFRFGGPGCNDVYHWGERLAAFPQGLTGIAIPPEAQQVHVSFWHHWGFDPDGPVYPVLLDGATLTLSIDGAAPVAVPGSAFVAGTPYSDGAHFTRGQPNFVYSEFDLDAVCAAALGSPGCAGHTLRIGFEAESNGFDTRDGWFLDDVKVTACTLHGCTGAPTLGAATTPADNQVGLSWSNGSPPSSSFRVYRATGTCAAPGPLTPIAGPLLATSFTDAEASGGTTYAYRVSGLDGSGLCESDLSGCSEATPSGPCLLPPLFAGLAGVSDPSLANCTLNLSWPAATSQCGNGVTYTVYRGTAPLFAPDAGSVVATGVTGTSFSDPGPLLSGTEHFYIVRAVDAGNGRSESNLQRRSAIPTGPLTLPGTRAETFERVSSGGFDLDGWSHAAFNGGTDWSWRAVDWVSPYHSWYVQPFGQGSDRVLVSPAFQARAGSSVAFWHHYDFFPNDGATLEISTDSGATWSVVPDAAFRAGGFTGVIPTGTTNPLGGLRGWVGASLEWTEVQVDLSAWAGSAIRLRWRCGADDGTGWKPWFVDSVTFSGFALGNSCQSAPQPPLRFYTVTPCRLVDTRNAAGPYGGPAFQTSDTRSFTLTGRCGIPVTAKALSLNVTVVEPRAPGFLTLFRGDAVRPTTSSINYAVDVTRANNAVLALSDGSGILTVFASDGPVHLILDVNGYFE